MYAKWCMRECCIVHIFVMWSMSVLVLSIFDTQIQYVWLGHVWLISICNSVHTISIQIAFLKIDFWRVPCVKKRFFGDSNGYSVETAEWLLLADVELICYSLLAFRVEVHSCLLICCPFECIRHQCSPKIATPTNKLIQTQSQIELENGCSRSELFLGFSEPKWLWMNQQLYVSKE